MVHVVQVMKFHFLLVRMALSLQVGGILSPVYFLKVIDASTKETLFKGEKDEVVK